MSDGTAAAQHPDPADGYAADPTAAGYGTGAVLMSEEDGEGPGRLAAEGQHGHRGDQSGRAPHPPVLSSSGGRWPSPHR